MFFKKKKEMSEKEKMILYIKNQKAAMKRIDTLTSFILQYENAQEELEKVYTIRNATVEEQALANACMEIKCFAQAANMSSFESKKIQYGRLGLRSQWEFAKEFLTLLNDPEVKKAVRETRYFA